VASVGRTTARRIKVHIGVLARPLCLLILAGGASVAHALLPIQTWSTSSGARVLFVESRALPMLDISVDFPAGSGYDSKALSGRAAFTQRLLRLGAGGLSENELAQRAADVGARVGGRFDADRAGVDLRTLSSARERDAALDVLARILQQPEFPDGVLEREKARAIASLKESDTKPDTLASRTFSRMVFREHPYALRAAGEVDTIAKLTRADLVAFYRSHYVAEQAVVAVIGDLSRADAERIGEQLTAGLPRSGGEHAAVPPVAPLDRADKATLAHPASQAHILIGTRGIRRGDPDYFPIFVGNYVLGGGGFASRLNDEVRQKRGLAYSVYSYFAPLSREGVFQIGLQTRGDQVQAALDVVMGTLKAFLEHGPGEEELAAAKNNIIGGFPMRIDSNRKIVEYLALIGFYRLPLSYLEDFVRNVEQVTVADVRAAFAKHLHPDRLATVVVGGGAETLR